jgi:hypothetical protein
MFGKGGGRFIRGDRREMKQRAGVAARLKPTCALQNRAQSFKVAFCLRREIGVYTGNRIES